MSHRIFVYPDKFNEGKIAVATIPDEELDPFKVIHPDGILVEEQDFPANAKSWFECLEFGENKKIVINFEKARLKTKERLRQERKILLEEQDVLFQRALEDGKPTAEIVFEKRRLRDLTKLPNSCSTLEELKNLTSRKNYISY